MADSAVATAVMGQFMGNSQNNCSHSIRIIKCVNCLQKSEILPAVESGTANRSDLDGGFGGGSRPGLTGRFLSAARRRRRIPHAVSPSSNDFPAAPMLTAPPSRNPYAERRFAIARVASGLCGDQNVITRYRTSFPVAIRRQPTTPRFLEAALAAARRGLGSPQRRASRP